MKRWTARCNLERLWKQVFHHRNRLRNSDEAKIAKKKTIQFALELTLSSSAPRSMPSKYETAILLSVNKTLINLVLFLMCAGGSSCSRIAGAWSDERRPARHVGTQHLWMGPVPVCHGQSWYYIGELKLQHSEQWARHWQEGKDSIRELMLLSLVMFCFCFLSVNSMKIPKPEVNVSTNSYCVCI